jgi:lipid A 3-O-deacylase
VLANTQGGIFGYGGFYSDLALGRFVLTPLAAVGGYHHGGSEDLGGIFQFHLSADLSYQFTTNLGWA